MNIEEKKYISDLFKARFPFLYICSWEETRVTEAIKEIVTDKKLIHTQRQLYVWEQTTGFLLYQKLQYIQDTEHPLKALEFIEKNEEPAVFILKDFHVNFGLK